MLLNSQKKRQKGKRMGPVSYTHLNKKYPKCKVLLTLGSKGACCYDGDKIYSVGCHKVNVVDTTAAGDTFTGYFIYGVLNNYSIEDSLVLATTASAVCVGRNGAADSVPLKSEIDSLINEEMCIRDRSCCMRYVFGQSV